MRIEHLRGNLERRASRGAEIELGGPASSSALDELARRLAVPVPQSVVLFYSHHDGIRVKEPHLEVLPVERLVRNPDGLAPFCRLDHEQELAFSTEALNEAGEWSIVSVRDGFLVTLTMASFWSNKMLAWIDGRRRIWAPEAFP